MGFGCRTYFITGILFSDSDHDAGGVCARVEHDHVRAEQHVAQDKACAQGVGLKQWYCRNIAGLVLFLVKGWGKPWKPLPLWTQDCMTVGSLMYLQQRINAGLGLQNHQSKSANAAGERPCVVGNLKGVPAHFHEEGGVRQRRFRVFDLEINA